RKELVPDSGGPGRFRGGLGQRIQMRSVAAGSMAVSFLAERTRIAAPGLFGGGDGALGQVNHNGRPIDPKLTHVVQPGDLLELVTPGGGGFGPPEGRDPALLEQDRERGYISPRPRGRGLRPAPASAAARPRPAGCRARSRRSRTGG